VWRKIQGTLAAPEDVLAGAAGRGGGRILFLKPGQRRAFLPLFQRLPPRPVDLVHPFTTLVIVGASTPSTLPRGWTDWHRTGDHQRRHLHAGLPYVAAMHPSAYLQIPRVGEPVTLAFMCGAMVGAGLGFLWFNYIRRGLYGGCGFPVSGRKRLAPSPC